MEATAIKLIEKQCQKHLANQGITTIKKLQYRLQEIFEQAEHQSSALVGIYKLIIPDWERIERLEGYPVVGRGCGSTSPICSLTLTSVTIPKFSMEACGSIRASPPAMKSDPGTSAWITAASSTPEHINISPKAIRGHLLFGGFFYWRIS